MPYVSDLRDIFNPRFDRDTNEWHIQVPKEKVASAGTGFEARLPLILVKELAPGGNFIRKDRRRYREWLLRKQGGLCSVCGNGPDATKGRWNLGHRPPMGEPDSIFIDYEHVTENRVVHEQCHERASRESGA